MLAKRDISAVARAGPAAGVDANRAHLAVRLLATRRESYKLPRDAYRKHVVDMSWTPPPVPPPPPATLVEAVQRRDAGRVRAFLALGVAIDERNHSLCVAAADGSVALMRLLLDSGADPNARGGLALTLAVDGGHLEAVRLLLESGSLPDALHGEAYRLAVFHERHDIASLLLQYGAATAQGPPATLPSGQNPGGDAPGDDSNKENRLPLAL